MTTYSNTDVLNQQATVASNRVALMLANAALSASQAQLQVIQATIAQQVADAAAAAAATPTPTPS